MVIGKGEAKPHQEYRTGDFAATKVTRNGGVKTQQKYSSEDCGATMAMAKTG